MSPVFPADLSSNLDKDVKEASLFIIQFPPSILKKALRSELSAGQSEIQECLKSIL
jgi:hypothetical protein